MPPTISSFTLPPTSNTLTVPITTFTATDNTAITAYCLTETNSSTACTWTTTVPANYIFTTAGSKSLYVFAKDAAGNISASASAQVTITLSDATAPTTTFTIPPTSATLTVPISTFTATDNTAVTAYCLSESNSSTACSWTTTVPTAYIFTSSGSKTLYAFAKDAAGNISTSTSAQVTITLPDTTTPTISTFTLPPTSTTLTVPITTFTAADNTAVTAYCLSETNNSSACTWTTAVPANYIFTTAGSKTLYAFAKDAAGNISTSKSAATLIDTTPPTVSAGANQTKAVQFTQVGTATDVNPLTYAWSKQSGAGTITFGSPHSSCNNYQRQRQRYVYHPTDRHRCCRKQRLQRDDAYLEYGVATNTS